MSYDEADRESAVMKKMRGQDRSHGSGMLENTIGVIWVEKLITESKTHPHQS